MIYIETMLFGYIEDRVSAGKAEKEVDCKAKGPVASHRPNCKSEVPRLPVSPRENERQKHMEIAKLEEHIELLAGKLAEMQALGSVEEAEERGYRQSEALEAEIRSRDREILARDRSIAVMQNQIGQLKDQCAELANKMKAAGNLEVALRAELKVASERISRLTDAQDALENRLSMLIEDCYRFANLIEERISLMEKLQLVTGKLKKLELDVAAGTVDFTGESAVVVQLDDPIFVIIHPIPSQSLPSLSPPDLSHFRIPKPPFSNFVSREIPASRADIADIVFKQWVEVTVRGILDAKYAEQLMETEVRGRSSFPEFVYAWMGQYLIDEKKREIVPLDWTHKDQVDSRRYQLLLGISTEKAKKAWEIWTFREFLMESLDNDTLAFFLHCRHLLFHGPQLLTTAGKYAVVHYVSLPHASAVIDLIMSKLTIIDRSSLKSKLEERARNRGGCLYIDSAYVLRLLLVYYERERKEKYSQMEALFAQVPKADGKYIDFSGFRQIVQNFAPGISDLDLAAFYRQVWSQSRGQITPDSLFTSANDSFVLSSTLRLPTFWPAATLNQYNDLETGISPLCDLYATAVTDWKAAGKRLEVMKEAIARMGLIDAYISVGKAEMVFRRKGQMPSEEMGGRHVFEVYMRFWTIFSQASVVQTELFALQNYEIDQKLYTESLTRALSGLKESGNCLHTSYFAMKVDKFVTRLAVNRIQRAWKAKKPQKRTRKSIRRGGFIDEFPAN